MGSDEFYPEERPVHRVERRRLLDRRAPRDRGRATDASSARPGTRPSPNGRSTRLTTPTRIPSCSCPGRSCSARRRPRRARTTFATGGSTCRVRTGRSPPVPGTTINGATGTRSSRWPTRTRRRTRPGPASRSRPRRSGSTRRAAGSTARGSPGATSDVPNGTPDGQHLAGRVPVAQLEGRRLRGDLAGRELRAERLRAARHVRERLGVDERLLPDAARRRGRAPVLRAAEPARQLRRSRPSRSRAA